MQAKRKVYPVRQCGVCRIGKMIYSKFRKTYKCNNERCGQEEAKAQEEQSR